jgi:class 3 adenylate cyclase
VDDVGNERSFSFVDLAGFTALTEAHGDAEAVAVIEGFIDIVRAALGSGDRLVKSMGDAVMIVSPDPASALAVVRSLSAGGDEAIGLPLLRAGIHHGAAIERDGDYFGAAVNLAARVAARAGGGQVLVTASVAQVARDEGLELTALGRHQLRHLTEPIELFQVHLGKECATTAIDPVCHMRVDIERAAGSLHHEGVSYWFCSMDCAARFAANPERFSAT